jgi:zinc-ribbon domain
MKFCTSCGAELPPEARFCGGCGASVGAVDAERVPVESPNMAPLPPPASESVYVPPVYEAAAVAYGFENLGEPKSNLKVILGGTLAAFALLGVLYYFIFVRDDIAENAGGTPTAETKPAEVLVQSKQFFAVTQANIRDTATAVGSTVIGKLPRGTAVSGKIILGVDGTSDWLELDEAKGFVGVVNLSDTAPPTLSKMLGDKIWAADTVIAIYTKPDVSSTLVDRTAVGTKLTLVGLTANDFIEIKLSKGGVGYIADGARIIALAQVTSKPIAISFNPNTCNYGGEVEVLFDQLSKQSQAKRKAIENAKYSDDDAREAALTAFDIKHETDSAYMKLQRSYNGLTVTGIGQHYESQSLYFAEPVAKVIEILRAQGLKIGKDGQMTSEVYAGVDAISKNETAFGRSSLSCGV